MGTTSPTSFRSLKVALIFIIPLECDIVPYSLDWIGSSFRDFHLAFLTIIALILQLRTQCSYINYRYANLNYMFEDWEYFH